MKKNPKLHPNYSENWILDHNFRGVWETTITFINRKTEKKVHVTLNQMFCSSLTALEYARKWALKFCKPSWQILTITIQKNLTYETN